MSKEIVNLFIETDHSEEYPGYQCIYTIGVFSNLEEVHQIIYSGETSCIRDWNYPPKIMDRCLELSHVARVGQMVFKGDTVEKRLRELGENNPFKTTNLKTFRCIIERVYIDLFDTGDCNTQKREFPREVLNAGYVLHVLSRKYRSIPKCLDIMSKLSIYDFDFVSKKFIVDDNDSRDVVDLKMEINSISDDVLKFIQHNKYLRQGGYHHTDLIYSDENVDIIVGSNLSTPGPEYGFIEHLWNRGSSKDCLCLYKHDNRYLIVVDPSSEGLGVDIRAWFEQINRHISLTDTIVDKIEEELLSIS